MKDACAEPFHQFFPVSPERLEAVLGHPAEPFAEWDGGGRGAVLLAAPHAGRFYPSELLDRARLPLTRLRGLEDPLVDLLIGQAVAGGATAIVGNYARAWIDLNRRETEIDARQTTPPPPAHADHRSPRVSAGLGLIPRTTGDGRPIYDRLLPLESVAARIREVHRPYHARVAALLAGKRADHGIAMLCDMHSMPPLPAAHTADVVIGDRHGQTSAGWLTRTVADWLTARGLRVVSNLPYAGGYGVERHGDPANAVHALQLEFCRRLYLEKDGVSLNANAPALSGVIAELAAMLRDMLGNLRPHRLAAE